MTPITLSSGALDATVLPRGAALTGLRLAGLDRNLVLEVAGPEARAGSAEYAGALVGPVANRVRGGLVEIDGTRHYMPLNERGATCLHSGPEGLHARTWEVAGRTSQSVTLTVALPDGACGLPGRREITATYAVADRALTLTIRATTDRTTPMNIAAHPYWNLDGGVDITGHRLQLAADHYLPVDAATLPTSELAPVDGTDFDFREPHHLRRDPGLDVNFCLADASRPAPVHAATLTGADGTRMTLATTAPGLQVYGGAYLAMESTARPGNPPLAPYAGVALEPQFWPDAPNHAHFPSILLHPGQTWQQQTVLTFQRA
jgi:aldose 1-epimerase